MHTSVATVLAPVAALVFVQHDAKMFSPWLNIVVSGPFLVQCAQMSTVKFFFVVVVCFMWGVITLQGKNTCTSASVNNAKTWLLIDVALESERVNALTSWRGRFTQVRMSFCRLKMRFMAVKGSRSPGSQHASSSCSWEPYPWCWSRPHFFSTA